jgi:glycine cleavage system pyridoxal-binding protein P
MSKEQKYLSQMRRTEQILPSAVMCGYKVIELKTREDGEMDLEVLKAHLGPKTAGIMLTNPSTLGVFMSRIKEVASLVHQAGGLLYYDGANLNAILGETRPGDMGFDVIHLNLHKTFATPHGWWWSWFWSCRSQPKIIAIFTDANCYKRGRYLSICN